MRLITHNMLQCNVKNCNVNNFPLRFEEVQLVRQEAEPNFEFIKNMLPRLDLSALLLTATELGFADLPVSLDEPISDEVLQFLHSLLIETQVVSGKMICRGCEHIYPIKDGIANMLLAEHEL